MIQLTSQSRVGKVTENGDLRDLVFFREFFLPCAKVGLDAVLALEADVPMLKVHEGYAGGELFLFEQHVFHLLFFLI